MLRRMARVALCWLVLIYPAHTQPPRGGSSTLAPIDQLLSGKAIGQVTRIDKTLTGTYLAAMTPLTKRFYNGAVGDPYASDAAVASGSRIGNGMAQLLAFGGPFINQDASQIYGFGGGHAASNSNDVNGFDVNAAVASMVASNTPGSWRNIMQASGMFLGTDTQCPSPIACPPPPSKQPNPGSSVGSLWTGTVNATAEGSGGGPQRLSAVHPYHASVAAGAQAVIGGNFVNINNQGIPGAAEIINVSTTNSSLICSTTQTLASGDFATSEGFAAINLNTGIGAGATDYNDPDDQIVVAAVQTFGSANLIELGGWPKGSLWRTCDPTTFAGSPLSVLFADNTSSFSWAHPNGFVSTIKYFQDVGTTAQGDVFQHICTGSSGACPNGNYIVTKNIRPNHTGSSSLINGGGNAAYTGTACNSWAGRDDYAAWAEARDQGLLLRWGKDANLYKVTLTSALTNMACALYTALTGDPLPSNASDYVLAMRYQISPAGKRYVVLSIPDEANSTVFVGIAPVP